MDEIADLRRGGPKCQDPWLAQVFAQVDVLHETNGPEGDRLRERLAAETSSPAVTEAFKTATAKTVQDILAGRRTLPSGPAPGVSQDSLTAALADAERVRSRTSSTGARRPVQAR